MPSTEFFVTSLVVILIPGTGVVYTLSTAIFWGRRASIFAALGCTAGILPHLTASILGLTAILHMSAVVFQLMKFLGVAYLLYLAWSMWRDSDSVSFNAGNKVAGDWRICIKGLLINILNPKLSLFFLAFLPQFLTPETTTPVIQMSLLAGIFMSMTFIVFVLYGLLAGSIRSSVLSSPRLVRNSQRVFAALFAALGLRLAMAER